MVPVMLKGENDDEPSDPRPNGALPVDELIGDVMVHLSPASIGH
jgi:hypothetical protein